MAQSAEDFPTFSQPLNFSDLELVVERRSFHVHKAILAHWSPVFRAMLTSDFKERSANRISLPKKRACDVLELLQVLYPPEKPIDCQNVETILRLAREYQIQSLTNRCEKFLLTMQSSLQTLVIADQFQLQELLSSSAQQLAKNSLTTQGIWNSEKFHHLEVATRLTVVQQRLHNMSVTGRQVMNVLMALIKINDTLSYTPPPSTCMSREWLCDVHKDSWRFHRVSWYISNPGKGKFTDM